MLASSLSSSHSSDSVVDVVDLVVGLTVVVLAAVVPVGVVMGIRVSGTVVLSGVRGPEDSELEDTGSNPSGGSGILDSQMSSLLSWRNQAGSGFLVVVEVLGTQP